MNRRDFIQLTALQSSLLTLPALSSAQQKKWIHDNWQGFFVTVVLDGAWDISLSLDPWIGQNRPAESDYFIEYTDNELIPFSSHFVGPALMPLKAHFQDCRIINGVFMSTNDNGHESLKSYALSGDSSSLRACFNLELALTLLPSYFTVLSDRPLQTGLRANAVTQMEIAKKSIADNDFSLAEDFIQSAQSGILAKVREAQKDKSNLTAARNAYEKIKQQFPDSESAALAASAFKAGLSKTAVLETRQDLDTHDNHPGTHLQNQTQCWEYVDRLFKIFKSTEYANGVSLFDMTTFMITSEFSRTPALNNAKGKDHNPWSNSVLLAGRGIKGGQVHGASHLIPRKISKVGIPYITGLPFDFDKKMAVRSRDQITSNTDAILPQNILRTLADAMDLNLNVIGGGLANTKSV